MGRAPPGGNGRRSWLCHASTRPVAAPGLAALLLGQPAKHGTPALAWRPQRTDLALFNFVGVVQQMRALVFEQRHAAIHQLGHKVGVKPPARRGQAKAAGRRVQVAHPVPTLRVAVDQLRALKLFPAVLQVGQHRKVVFA
jgi:hypothetical protein